MKATELRISNLVKIDEMLRGELFDTNEVITDTDTFKIATIDTMFVNLYINSCEYEFNLSDLQPIPLTEEWLIKCGFGNHYCEDRENDVFSICVTDAYDFVIEPYYYGGDLVDPHFMAVQYLGQIEVEIKSVHSLQNIISALTGKELEIK